MVDRKHRLVNGFAAALLLSTGLAQAALVPLTLGGVDVVCDDDYTPVGASSPGLIWTADANLAASETFGVSGINPDGMMTWDKAQEWIDAMNADNYGGANDWRLWSALNSDGSGPCGGSFCNNSELGHLFYIEGGLSFLQPITSSTALTAVFTNLQVDDPYWSGSVFRLLKSLRTRGLCWRGTGNTLPGVVHSACRLAHVPATQFSTASPSRR